MFTKKCKPMIYQARVKMGAFHESGMQFATVSPEGRGGLHLRGGLQLGQD